MIRGFVEAMLGEAGTSVLRFYEGHALALGLLIVAYGVLMYLSWTALVRIYRFLVAAAAATLMAAAETDLPARHGAKRSGSQSARSEPAELPWQAAVDSVRFPLVSRRAGLLPMRKSVAAAKAIIDERELWEHAAAVARGADVRRIAPEYRLASPRQVSTHGKD